jgi:FkbM family methyltransferase
VVKKVLGFKMILDLQDRGACRDLYHYGIREREATDIYKSFLTKEDNVLDIGANIGIYTLLSSSLTKGNIYAIEPDPRTYKLLNKNIKINGLEERVKLYNVAMGDKKGKLEFYQSKSFNWSSVARENEKGIQVKVDTVDDFGKDREISCLRFDLEGYEHSLLKGARKTLKKKLKIFMEVHPLLIKEYGGDVLEMFEMLKDFKLKYYNIPEMNYFKKRSAVSICTSTLKGRLMTPWKTFSSNQTIKEVLSNQEMRKLLTETMWYHVFLEKI